VNGFWLALSFLTTLPARQVPYAADGLGKAAAWFPVVGLLIGLLLVLVHAGGRVLLGPLPAAVLVVTVWAVLTGGLHLDGLADCCDGLLVSAGRERRLEILRDPRVGSFAVVGLVLALLLKTAGVSALPAAAPGLLLAPVWARWWILVAARRPLARPGGLGSSFAAALTPRTLGVAALLPLVLLGLLAPFDWRSIFGVGLSAVACFGVLRLAEARIGGVTGDVYGAVVELSEIALILGLAQA
jgi:cobalamin 5'-phosphate synthase/cobalamin synthase